MKQSKTLSVIIIIIVSFIFSIGCGVIIPLVYNKDKLFRLELMMTKEEVRKKIGNPDEVRGSIINRDGDIVVVWQYDLYKKSEAASNLATGFFLVTITWWLPDINGPNPYWLYFVDDRLAQWGRGGDWRPDVIAEIRLKKQ